MLLPSALLDLVALNFISLGYVLTRDPATKEILKSSTMIWCCLISIPLFQTRPKLYQWLGIVMISIGGFVKVSVTIPGIFPHYIVRDYCNDNSTALMTEDGNSDSSIGIGYLMFVIGYFFISCAFIYQEWVLRKYTVPPVRLAAWEGILGLTLQGLLLIPLYFIKSKGTLHLINLSYFLRCFSFTNVMIFLLLSDWLVQNLPLF